MQAKQAKAENFRTLIYLGTSIVLVVIALLTFPWIEPPQPAEEINKPLFDYEKLTADNVSFMEIVQYEPTTDQLREFQVEKDSRGYWTIPSSDNYPADAEEQMTAALTSFTGLTVLDVIPDAESLFEDYGVLEPDRADLEPGQEGVGTLVELKDRTRNDVASIIIGNRDSENPALRFVRKPGQPLIYVVEYDPSVLKTDFRDWIEKDLLQLDAIDIASVTFNDYQIIDSSRLKQRFKATVESQGTRWNLAEFVEFDDEGTPTERTIGTGEQLNNQRLNQMATALDSLEIVDVARKPEGLGADLTSVETSEDLLSLVNRGFRLIKRQENQVEVVSDNGEMTVETKDGVRYRLRFGKTRATDEGIGGSFDRFMMVSATVNEDRFPMPPEPVLPTLQDFQNNSDAPQPPGDEPPPPPGDTQDSDAQDEATPAEATAQEKSPEQQLDEAKRRIEAEYRQRVDERNAALQAAKDRVEALNLRFADWYYVVSEDAFKTVRLGRDELIVTPGSQAAPAPANPGAIPPGPNQP